MFAKDKVKVSDFGLSRALGVEKDYYQSQPNSNLVLPIAWCAPECVNYLKFTSASDVWSYGVTLWEMFSGGAQPWQGMTGVEIMQTVDEPDYRRLEQPDRCPDDWYQLMLKCWAVEPADRPKFSEMFLVTLSQMKPVRVAALKDVTSGSSTSCLSYKASDIIIVLSKKPHCEESLGTTVDAWKGVIESNNQVGYFDPANTAPYLEMRAPAPVLRKTKVTRIDSSRSSLRTGRKLNPGMIGLPQNDLRHIGHVGYDGAVFGDVSFIGDNYSKLPIKVGNTQNQSGNVTVVPTNGDVVPVHSPETKCDRMVISTLEMSSKPKDEDDFGDFEMPDLSISLDFGSSLMDEVMKSLGSPTPTSNGSDVTMGSSLFSASEPVRPVVEHPAAGRVAAVVTESKSVPSTAPTVATTMEDGSDTETGSENNVEDEEEDGDSEAESAVSNDQDIFNAVVELMPRKASSSQQHEVSSDDEELPAIRDGCVVTATVQSDFIPPIVSSPSPKSDESLGGSKPRLVLLDVNSSSGVRALRTPDSYRLQKGSVEDDDDEDDNEDNASGQHADTNGFGYSALAAYDALIGGQQHKRSSSGSSSGGHSIGRGSTSAAWKTSSELSVGSATELSKGGTTTSAAAGGRTQLRSTNQNIRAPQGIPGRSTDLASIGTTGAVRKPFINPSAAAQSHPVSSGADDTELMDTNPLRRLRESQSGFANKPIFRPLARSPAEPLPVSNNLNVNLSFFDKLKEQEQEGLQ
jgi:serine/threonine protein kinase